MFGNEITLAQTGLITAIGMGTVFCVLILLVGILELFNFIPKEKTELNTISAPVPTTNKLVTQVLDDVSPLHKAIIISSILEYLGEDKQQYKVRITRMKKII